MRRDEKGTIALLHIYVTFVLMVLIAFSFLLSGGLMPMTVKPAVGATKYMLKNTTPLFPEHKTLQLATLNFVPVPIVCDPGLNYGDEPGILYAFFPACDDYVSAGDKIKAWYTDEHALTMGKNTSGMTSLPVSAMPTDGSRAMAYPQVGDRTAKDQYGLPFFPGVYITDITLDPTSTAGDAQHGGTGISPSMVYGSWKALGEADPSSSGINYDTLPPGADPFSSILPKYINTNTGRRGTEHGYQAELIWNVNDLGLVGGRTYRAHFVIHDGDQTGDIGLGCITIVMNE